MQGQAGPPVAVIICRWQADKPAVGVQPVPELVVAAAQACLQGWSHRVTGSCCGMTQQAVGLLLVPVYGLAAETAQSLGGLLNATAHAAVLGAGHWVLQVVGPLEPGPPDQVRRQLAQAGWSIN